MNNQTHRKDIRVATGPGFTLSFTLKGHGFRGIRIMNLSAGGCFILLEARTARFFLPGAVLEDLVLLHPDLPKAPLTAAVAYVLGYTPGGGSSDQVGLGLQFLALDAPTRLALEAWVRASAAGGEATS
jgi:Tfp pilus assembly protein PilZ